MATKKQQEKQASALATVFSAGKTKQPVKAKEQPQTKEVIALDLAGRKDYLKRIAGAKGLSVTKYLQQLIDADIQKNQALYDQLKDI